MKSDLKLQLRVGAQHQLSPLTNIAYDKMRESGLKHGDVVSVTIHGEKRSGLQNNMQYAWYSEIAKFEQQTTREIRGFCKLEFGIPILREEPSFDKYWCKYWESRYTYEELLFLLGGAMVSVTSLFNKAQETRYLNDIQFFYSNKGLILEAA